jgi:hypothetical protein
MELDEYFNVNHKDLAWLKSERNGWQFGEQGLIDAIVAKLRKRFVLFGVAVEIGAGDGESLPLTCERLIGEGWHVIAYEADDTSRGKLQKKYADIDVRGKYRFGSVDPCSVLIIDIDGADSIAMGSALATCQPSLVVVEHYDKAGPYVTSGVDSFDEPVPEWLLGMPLGVPKHKNFVIQSQSEHLDEIANSHGYAPVCQTRVNSFYVPKIALQELFHV